MVENPSGGGDPLIAYLGRILPTLSETFVIREIAALVRLGTPVTLLSLYPPESLADHPETQGLALQVTILFRPGHPLFWLAHIFFGLFHPCRYWGCVWRYVLTAAANWQERARLAAYFLTAPYAAWCLRQQKVAHVHAHFANSPASVALMATHLAGRPFSFMAHAYDIFVDTLLLPEKLRAAQFVATCSFFNVRYLREHFPEAQQARLEVVRYGLDPAAFPPRRQPQNSVPRLIGVGRLVETKGFHTLIQACRRLRDQEVPFTCWLIGAGPEATRLQALVQELGLTHQVALLGRRLPREIKTFYEQADILVMPSCVRHNDRDGIPNVLLEAMAMEIPVISTYVSGIPEMVRPAETGLLVEPDDPDALAGAIKKVLDDPDLAHRLARQARTLVEQEFNIYRSARRLLELFDGATIR